MDLVTVFLSTFTIVFIGELGDKTQIAAGTGALANKGSIWTIFYSSSLALILAVALAVFFAGLIPSGHLPLIKKVGGALLVLYGVYLFFKTDGPDGGVDLELSSKNIWELFFCNFWVVFIAELGDKTQIATLAIAIENQLHLSVVFTAAAAALVTVTAITVWGATKIPNQWVKKVQQIGASLMIAYGAYMLVSAT